MRTVLLILFGLMIALQLQLWSGDGGMREVSRLQQAIESQRQENAILDRRNRALEAEVLDLKQGLEAVEERARSELGMIRNGETFYQVIEPDSDSGSDAGYSPGPDPVPDSNNAIGGSRAVHRHRVPNGSLNKQPEPHVAN